MNRPDWTELETLALRFADTGIYADLSNFSEADAAAALAMLRRRIAKESAELVATDEPIESTG